MIEKMDVHIKIEDPPGCADPTGSVAGSVIDKDNATDCIFPNKIAIIFI